MKKLNIKKIAEKLRASHLGKLLAKSGYFAAMQTTPPQYWADCHSRLLKVGDKVRMSEALKTRMRGACSPGKHVEPLPNSPPLDYDMPDDGCLRCSTAHVEEFGDCIGIVIGQAEPGWPEVDVRWEQSLRYAYLPEDLEKVD